MQTDLRPLTLGEILDRTAQLYRTNFLLFAGISAVLAAVVLLLRVAMIGVVTALHMSTLAMARSWGVQSANWISFMLLLVIGEVATAANNRAVAWVYLGESASITGAYRSIIANMRRYLWIGTAKLAIAWSPVILLYTIFQACFVYFQHSGVVAQAGQAPNAPPTAGTMYFGLVSIAFFLLIWPALIYSVFMALRYALAVPASVVEGLTTRQALKRSIALTKGARGRIFVLWLMVTVIWTVALVVTQTFFIAYSMKHHLVIPWWLQVAQQLISFCTSTFAGPILAIGTCLFYFDQRVRKEGFDIEWMMQAAGMASSPAIDAPVLNAPANAPAPLAEEPSPQAPADPQPLTEAQAETAHE